jgi:hypothetical protein
MPKYKVIGFYTFKGVTEIEAPDEINAMEYATDLLPDFNQLEISETFIQEAELLPDVSPL